MKWLTVTGILTAVTGIIATAGWIASPSHSMIGAVHWQAWIPVYPSCRVAWEKSGKNHKEEAQSLIPSSQSQFRVIWRYTIPEISAIIWAASASLPEKSRIMTARR